MSEGIGHNSGGILVENAIATVRDFLDQAFKAGLLEES